MPERTPVGTAESRPAFGVRAGLVVALAVAVNTAIVLGLDTIALAPGFQALSVPPVAFLSAVGALGAAGAYALAHRYTSDGDRTFVRLAAVVLVLSFIPDVGLLFADPTATLAGVLVLMALHVVVAAIAVGVLVYWQTR